MRIMLTGATGQVGWELHRTLLGLGQVVPFTHQNLDLANGDIIRKTVREVMPTLIVNAVAYTAVDKAESEPDLAMAVNGIAPGILAEEAKRIGACLVHYSTDYVFDGTKTSSYQEGDVPNPISVYGHTKLAGEQAIENVQGDHLIFRTSWVYGARGKNFLLTIMRLAQDRKELQIVDDQIGAPTWSRMIAVATTLILDRCIHRGARTGDTVRLNGAGGIYHLCAGGKTSWYGFASKIVESLSQVHGGRLATLLPIPTRDYPLPAQRPLNSQLDNTAVQNAFGICTVPWDTALALCLRDIEANRAVCGL